MAECATLAKYAWKKGKPLQDEYFETGNIGLDMIVSNGKGLAVGSYTILTALPGAGKSTTLMDVAMRRLKEWKKSGLDWKIVYIDNEGSRNLGFQVGFQDYIDDGSLIYINERTTEDMFEEITKDILDGNLGTVKMFMIDSINNILSSIEEKTDNSTGDFGSATRARNKWYKKYLPLLSKAGVTIVSIAQNRSKQNAGAYEDPNKPAISNGDLHYADTILRLSKSTGGNNAETKKREITVTTSDKKEKISDTFLVKYSIYGDKNRLGNFPPTETLFKYGIGCANWFILHNILKTFKHLSNKGSATYPKWNFSKELQEGINVLAEEDMKKRDMQTYINSNMSAIKDFLRSRGEYCLVKENDIEDDGE